MATVKTPAKTVSVMLPKISGEDQTVFVGHNGKSWMIPRGKRVEVPDYVADIIFEAERNANAADDYSDAKRKDMEKIHGVEI